MTKCFCCLDPLDNTPSGVLVHKGEEYWFSERYVLKRYEDFIQVLPFLLKTSNKRLPEGAQLIWEHEDVPT